MRTLEILLNIRGRGTEALNSLREVQGAVGAFGTGLRGAAAGSAAVGQALAASLSAPARGASEVIQQTFGQIQQSSTSLISTLADVGQAFQGIQAIGGAIASLGKSFIGANIELENYTLAYQTLLGTQDAAKARILELQALNSKSPFELPDLIEADRLLESFGIRTAQLTQDVANAAAAIDPARLKDITFAIAQLGAGSFGFAFSRIAELGIATRQTLEAKGLKFDAQGSYQGSVDQAMAVVQEIIQSRFSTAAALASTSFEGIVSNISDRFFMLKATFGGAIFDVLKGQLSGILTLLGDPRFDTFAAFMGQGVGAAISALGSVISTTVGLISSAVGSISGLLNNATGGFVSFAGMIGAVFAPLGQALGALLAGDFSGFLSGLGTFVQNIGAILLGGFASLASNLVVGGQNVIASFAQGLYDGAARYVMAALNFITGLIASFLQGFSPPKKGPLHTIDTWFPNVLDAYLGSWDQADFGVLGDITDRISSAFETLVEEGQLSAEQAVQAVLGGGGQAGLTELVAQAINEIKTGGEVSGTALLQIQTLLGQQNASLFEQIKAQLGTVAIQQQISALEQQIKALDDPEARAASEDALRKAQDALASARTGSQARAAKEQIRLIQNQQREGDRQRRTLSAQLELLKAQSAELKDHQASLEAIETLHAREEQFLERIASATEKAYGGGGGGGGAIEKASDAAWRYSYRIADNAGKLGMLREKLAGLEVGSDEYYQTLGDIYDLEQSIAKETSDSVEARAQAAWDYSYALADNEGKLGMLREKLSGLEVGSVEYYKTLGQINGLETTIAGDREAAADAATKEAQARTDAEFQYQMKLADTAGKIGLLKGKLEETEVGSADYYAILGQIHDLEQQAAKEAEQAAGKAAKGHAAAGGAAKASGAGFAGAAKAAAQIGGGIDTISKAAEDAKLKWKKLGEEWDKGEARLAPVIGAGNRVFFLFKAGLPEGSFWRQIIDTAKEVGAAIADIAGRVEGMFNTFTNPNFKGPDALKLLSPITAEDLDAAMDWQELGSYARTRLADAFGSQDIDLSGLAATLGAKLRSALDGIDWEAAFTLTPGKLAAALVAVLAGLAAIPLAFGAVTAIGGVVGALLGPLSFLLGPLKLLLGPLQALGGSLLTVGRTFATLLGPVINILGPVASAAAPFVALYAGVRLLAAIGPEAEAAINGIARGLGTSLLNGLDAALPAIRDFVDRVITGFLVDMPRAIAILGRFANGLAGFILEAIPLVAGHIATFVHVMVDRLVVFGPDIARAGVQLFGTLGARVIEAVPVILSGLGDILVEVVRFLVLAGPDIAKGLVSWTAAFAGWLVDLGQTLLKSVGELFGRLFDASGIDLDFTGLGDKIEGGFVDDVLPVFDRLQEFVGIGLELIGPALAPIAAALGGIGLVASGALGPVLGGLVSIFGGLGTSLTTVGGVAMPLVVKAFNAFGGPLRSMVGPISSLLSPLSGLGGVFSSLGGSLGALLGPLSGLAGPLLAVLGPFGLLAAAVVGLQAAGIDLEPIIASIASTIGDALLVGLELAGDALRTFVPKILTALGQAVPKIFGVMTRWTEGISSFVQKAIPLVGRLLTDLVTNLLTFVSENLPAIGAAFGTWAASVGQFVLDAIPLLLTELANLLIAIGDWVVAEGPKLLAMFAMWAVNAVSWVIDALPTLLGHLTTFLDTIISWILTNAPTLVKNLLTWAGEFVAWLLPQLPGMLLKLGEFLAGILLWIGEKALEIGGKLLLWAAEFVLWIANLIPELPGKLADLATAVVGWIGEKAPELGAKLLEWGGAFLLWIADVVPKIPGKLLEIIGAVFTWIGEQTPNLGGKLLEWAGAFISWVGGVATTAGTWLGDIIAAVLTWIGDQVKAIGEKIAGWKDAFWSFVSGTAESAGEKLGAIVTAIGTWAEGVPKDIKDFFTKIGTAIVDFVIEGIGDIGKAIYDHTVGPIAQGAQDLYNYFTGDAPADAQTAAGGTGGGWESVGAAATAGIQKGIEKGIPDLQKTTKTAVAAVPAAAREELGMQSPSTVMRDLVGVPIMEGVSAGITQEAPNTLLAMNNGLTPLLNAVAGLPLPSAMAGVLQNLITQGAPLLNGFSSIGSAAFDALQTSGTTAANTLQSNVTTAAGGTASAASLAFTTMKDQVLGLLGTVQADSATAWGTVQTTATTAAGGTQLAVGTAYSAMQLALNTALTAISTDASTQTAATQTTVVGNVSTMRDLATSAFVTMKDSILTASGNVASGVAGQSETFKTSGKTVGGALADGIKAGIEAKAAAMAASAAAAVNQALASARQAADIHSPSRVFQQLVGLPISAGMALGISDGAGLVASATVGVITPLAGQVENAASGLGDPLVNALGAAQVEAASIIGTLNTNTTGQLESLRQNADVAMTALKDGISLAANGAEAGVTRATILLRENALESVNAMKDGAVAAMDSMAAEGTAAADQLTAGVTGAADTASTNVAGATAGMSQQTVAEYAAMAEKATAALRELEAAALRLVPIMAEAGRAIGQAISNGIRDGVLRAIDGIIQAAEQAAGSAIQAAKDLLGIASPSQVFRDQVGAPISQGLALGIGDEAAKVAASVASLTASVVQPMDGLGDQIRSTLAGANEQIGRTPLSVALATSGLSRNTAAAGLQAVLYQPQVNVDASGLDADTARAMILAALAEDRQRFTLQFETILRG